METATAVPPIVFEMKPVVSSQIASVGYDPETKTLAILFSKNRKVYHYFDVPKDKFDGFFARPDVSIGQYFAANIREKYKYKLAE